MTTAWPTPHKDPTLPGWVPLDETPGRYYVSRCGTYAHLVRSAASGSRPSEPGRPIICLDLLCGGYGRNETGFFVDEPGEFPICGTCHGRALGLDSDEPGIAFRPTKSLTSIGHRCWCPGSERLWLKLPDKDGGNRRDRGYCILCGYRGRLRCAGSAYTSTVSLERHHPEVLDVLTFCPSCGWRHLVLSGMTVSCSRHGCDWALRFEFEGDAS